VHLPFSAATRPGQHQPPRLEVRKVMNTLLRGDRLVTRRDNSTSRTAAVATGSRCPTSATFADAYVRARVRGCPLGTPGERGV